MTAVRVPLPHRRPSWTTSVRFRDTLLEVTVGFDGLGVAREVFATGPKAGSDMAHALSDACVAVSVALQHGVPAEAMAKSMGTVPVWTEAGEGSGPASPLGAILQVLTSKEWA